MAITSIVPATPSFAIGLDTSSSRPTSRSSSSTSSSSTSSAILTDVPAPGQLSSSSPSLTSSSATETTAASSQASAVAAQDKPTPAGSIAGLVIGLLLLVGLVLFGVRWFFIRKREHKTTPARSRISRLNISGPSNFTHLQSGAAGGVGMAGVQHNRTPGAADGPAAQMTTPNPTNMRTENAVAESPYDRIKQKYSFDLNQLETGLSDHMETMKSSRKNAPNH